MRELTSHKVNGLNDWLDIQVLDEPSNGNACHEYEIWDADGLQCCIRFQNGPIGEVGLNGISDEALLAIVEDRLKGFQSGGYGCAENDVALHHINAALTALHDRTRKRAARGVEGTNQK